MNLNQLTIIGFIGENSETKQLPNGAMITKFSVATTKSCKDDSGDWKSKTQSHNVISFGESFVQMASGS
jgi:single-strand DNA-binding protein